MKNRSWTSYGFAGLLAMCFIAVTSAQDCPPTMAGGGPPTSPGGAAGGGINLPSGLSGLVPSGPVSRTANFGASPTSMSGFGNGFNSYNGMGFGLPTYSGAMMPMATPSMEAMRAAAVQRNRQQFARTQMDETRRNSITQKHLTRALAYARSAEKAGRKSSAIRYYQRAAKLGDSESQRALDRLQQRNTSRSSSRRSETSSSRP